MTCTSTGAIAGILLGVFRERLLRLRVLSRNDMLFCRLRGARVFVVDKRQVLLALPALSDSRLVLYSPAGLVL